MKFENEVCQAFTFIEARGTFAGYQKLYEKFKGEPAPSREDWKAIVKRYKKLSQYMSDRAITEAHKYVMHEV